MGNLLYLLSAISFGIFIVLQMASAYTDYRKHETVTSIMKISSVVSMIGAVVLVIIALVCGV